MAYLDTKHRDYLYAAFRAGIGVLFLMHGLMKLLGLWGMPGGPAAFGTLPWYAGMAEALIGPALAFGVLTRLASLFGVIEMAVAYFMGHISAGGWNPLTNQGEPALLFMLAFLATLAFGAGKFSLENALLGKELF